VIAPSQGSVTTTSFASSTGTGAGVFQTSPTITTPTIDTITSAASTALTLKSAGTTAITVDTSQRVGIGTTTPTNILEIVNATNPTIRITDTTNNCYTELNATNTVGYVGTASNHDFGFTTNNSERMRILSTGEVGVKTSTPQTNLDIGGSTSQKGLEIRCGDQNDSAGGGIQIILAYSGNPWNSSGYSHAIKTRHDSAGGSTSAIDFYIWSTAVSANSLPTYKSMSVYNGGVSVTGALSKGSGSFKIDHPLTAKKDTHHLVHSFIEGPQADLIYRGKVSLVDGAAIINIDTASGMTEGTFVALCRDVQCFTTNESDWTPVRGSVTGNILTIEAQDNTSTASISWMVIGERQDEHMYDTDWTDENGKVIVEPLKEALEAK
jgi:hypothetical protein